MDCMNIHLDCIYIYIYLDYIHSYRKCLIPRLHTYMDYIHTPLDHTLTWIAYIYMDCIHIYLITYIYIWIAYFHT